VRIGLRPDADGPATAPVSQCQENPLAGFNPAAGGPS
jgi:hypothetical protein